MRTASPPPRPMTSSAAAATARQPRVIPSGARNPLPRGMSRSARHDASTRSVNPAGGSFRRSAAFSSLSMRFLQLAPQRQQGAVELTLYRVDAQPDDAADLDRAELFLVAQRDHETLHLRQRRDELAQ